MQICTVGSVTYGTSVVEAAGVDHHRLAGGAVGAGERDHLIGHVVAVGGPLECSARQRVLDLFGRSRVVIRVPSIRPGATQLTSTSGASATAKQRVRWFSADFETAYAMLLPVG